jgi:hypothetical protein
MTKKFVRIKKAGRTPGLFIKSLVTDHWQLNYFSPLPAKP